MLRSDEDDRNLSGGHLLCPTDHLEYLNLPCSLFPLGFYRTFVISDFALRPLGFLWTDFLEALTSDPVEKD